MNASRVGTKQTGRQHFSASRNHESAGIIFMDIYKEMRSAPSLQYFQLQFKVIELL